jgi:hypothetical protein
MADKRDLGEDYMDFYCSGNEGFVDKEIEEDLHKLGWLPIPWRKFRRRVWRHK